MGLLATWQLALPVVRALRQQEELAARSQCFYKLISEVISHRSEVSH